MGLVYARAKATVASHRYMLRAGMIRQNSAGIYTWLPLGHKVLKKIEQIVREEQNKAGAIEMLMPTIQSADLWKETGRYDAYGPEMLRITDRHDREMLYGPTNDQWKFRDERRPRFGVMRGREFLMKDTYSFDLTEEDAVKSYNKMFTAYLNTFARLGIKAVPMKADTGPIGGDLSHEFVILAESGESEVFCHRDLVEMAPPGDVDFDGDLSHIFKERTSLYAATEEMHDAEEFAKIPADKQLSARGIEVGHIFYFGDKYSAPMKAAVMDSDGKPQTAMMGSYGIGVSRLAGHEEADKVSEDIYEALVAAGIDPLLDDEKGSIGVKFSRMDLIGLPYQIAVGPRGLKDGSVEVKTRAPNIARKIRRIRRPKIRAVILPLVRLNGVFQRGICALKKAKAALA